MTEKQLQSAIVDCARLLGWRTYHTYDSRRSDPGFPDLTLARGTRLVFAELKSAKGRLSEAQAEWKAALELAGAPVYVWRPEDWLHGGVETVLRAGMDERSAA